MPAAEYPSGHAAIFLAEADDMLRQNLGRDTYMFVKRILNDPKYKEQIEAQIAYMRAAAQHISDNQEKPGKS